MATLAPAPKKKVKLPFESRGTENKSTIAKPLSLEGTKLSAEQEIAAREGLPVFQKDPIQEGVTQVLNKNTGIPPEGKTRPADFVEDNGPEVIRGSGGRVTGVSLPDGTTFLGLPESSINAILDKQGVRAAPRPDAVAAGTADAQAAQQATQAQAQQALSQGQAGLIPGGQLGQVPGASPDIGQALGAGVVGAIPGLVGGAVGGALTGAAAGAVGGPITALGGAIIGGIGGALTTFLSSTRSNLAAQQTDEFAKDAEALRKGDRYIRSLITDTNRNPQNAAENIALFYQTLNMIDAAHAKTWADSQENLNKFLGKDATKELAKFEVFDKTMRNYYFSQFQTALGAPNPNVNLITIEDLQEPLE